MKSVVQNMKTALLIISFSLVCSSIKAQNIDSVTDPRDQQVYETVSIGKQTWMTQNLNYETNGSFAYSDDKCFRKEYGLLYTWEAAKNACPSGWHLPSDDEWKQLESVVGMSESEIDNSFWRGTSEGTKLKTVVGWSPNSGTDSYGFSMLPGGYRSIHGEYDLAGEYGYCWTSTVLTNDLAWYRRFVGSKGQILRFTNNKQQGYSVRCLKDK